METIGYLDCGWEGVVVMDTMMRDTLFLTDAYDKYRGQKVKITIEPIP